MRTDLAHFVAATMRWKLCIFAAAITLFPAIGWSQEYTVTDLGTLGGDYSIATSVNNAGQVVGNSPTNVLTPNDDEPDVYPFIYSNGAMNAIITSDEWLQNYALAINNSGTVVGRYQSQAQDFSMNAFQWNGAFQDLAPENQSCAAAINDNGVSVGTNGLLQNPGYNPACSDFTAEVAIGVIFKDGNIINIPTGKYLAVNPLGINNSEQIAALCITANVAYLGCIVANGTQQLLQPVQVFSGEVRAYPAAINASGDTCGMSYTGNFITLTATVATYWNGLVPTSLGNPPGSKNSQCLGMDDYGNGVGNAIAKTGSQIGVLYDPVSGPRDLNKLIAEFFHKGHAFLITNAVSISDTGFIAAQCQYENGNNDACLLTPNPTIKLLNSIVAFAQGDPECISCEEELVPEARSLPKSLDGLSGDERGRVIATVKLIAEQIEQLERERKISESKATLLLHQAQLVYAAVEPQTRG
jgi:uncharacterized membrane protein